MSLTVALALTPCDQTFYATLIIQVKAKAQHYSPVCTVCFVTGRNSALKQSNNDHAQGLRNKSKLSCTKQVAEVKRVHKQKHLVLAEAILSQSARMTNQIGTGQSLVMWFQF